MKKLRFSIMTACMLLLFVPTQMRAENETTSVTVKTTNNIELTENNSNVAANTVEISAANTQLERLDEIKAMDMSTMSRAEKKELREEVRTIKEEMTARQQDDYDGYHHHGGVYISIGGGVLLILLLIILL
ncbi:MAG TPA: hypothetical protein VIK55_13625 [Paludibacter sp.]